MTKRDELIALADLRRANVTRQKEWDAFDQLTLAYRGNELAGEVGEACNVIKKLERERLGIKGSRDTVEHLAEELADIIICTDLIAMQAGIDLSSAVIAKFNASSEKVGLKTRLAVRSDAPGGVEAPAAGDGAPVAHRKMTREEYNALDLKGWHSVRHDEECEGVTEVSYTAQPADAAMREALDAEERYLLEHFGSDADIMPGDIEGAFHRLRETLTAPGATTKSDGVNPVRGAESASGAHVADRTGGATPPTGSTNPLAGKVPCHCHDPVSQRLCLDKDRCYTVEAQPVQAIKMPEYHYQEEDQRGGSVTFGGPTVPTLVDDPNSASGKRVEYRPSDPSSTRSEVTALADIAAERERQREVEGWSSVHDDGHDTGEMAGAAACYALSTIKHWAKDQVIKLIWPWADEWWKPKDTRRNLVKAGALIVAEIERLDRLEGPRP